MSHLSTRKRTIGRSKSADHYYFMLPLQQQDVIAMTNNPPPVDPPQSRRLFPHLFRSSNARRRSAVSPAPPTTTTTTTRRNSKPQQTTAMSPTNNPVFILFSMASLLMSVWTIASLLRHPNVIITPELNHHHQPQHVYRTVPEKRRQVAASKKEPSVVVVGSKTDMIVDGDHKEIMTTSLTRERHDRGTRERRDEIMKDAGVTDHREEGKERQRREMEAVVSPKRLGQGNNDQQEGMTPLEQLRQKIAREQHNKNAPIEESDTNVNKEIKQPADKAAPAVPAANVEKKIQHRPVNEKKKLDNADENTVPFICPIQNAADFHLHQPVVLLTQAHSGADALVHLMAQNRHILVVSDLFSDDRQQVPLLVRLFDQMKQNCGLGDRKVLYTPQQERFKHDIHALFAAIMTEDSGRDLYLELIQKFQNRFVRPWQWLAFIRRIPSVHSHFVFLLQREDWRHFQMPLEAFLLELQEHDSAFVIIYRQHLLQSYAVHQRVMLEEHSSDVLVDGKLTVEKETMERYMDETRNYFRKIRSFLQTKEPKQSLLFEYKRDLASASHLLSSYNEIQSLLQIPVTQQHLQLPGFSEDIPLPEQILNWDQIRDEWGYSEEWKEDLFGVQLIQNASIDSDTGLVDSPMETNLQGKGVICPTTDVHTHRPIFVFGTPRTGSNLVFNFLAMLGIVWPDTDMLNLVELLSPHASYSLKLFALSQIIDHMKEKCKVGDRAMRYFSKYKDFRTPEDMFASLMAEHSGARLFQKLHDQFQKRIDNPMNLIRFLQGIPSPRESYFALKVFPEHVENSVHPFVSQIPQGSMVIVLWRRNLLEAYVSLQVALSTNHWMNVETTAEDAITIDKTGFENYMKSTKQFYHQIKTAFAENNVTFTAFEYHADLSDVSRQEETIRHLQFLLEHKPDSKVTKEVMQGLWTTKQATVSLEERILNWDDVVEWGYNRPTEDWENLF